MIEAVLTHVVGAAAPLLLVTIVFWSIGNIRVWLRRREYNRKREAFRRIPEDQLMHRIHMPERPLPGEPRN